MFDGRQIAEDLAEIVGLNRNGRTGRCDVERSFGPWLMSWERMKYHDSDLYSAVHSSIK